MMIAITPTRRPHIAAGDHSELWLELENSCGVTELAIAIVTWEVCMVERE
jgi:hypothetical protein